MVVDGYNFRKFSVKMMNLEYQCNMEGKLRKLGLHSWSIAECGFSGWQGNLDILICKLSIIITLLRDFLFFFLFLFQTYFNE